jgi:multiple sugar transport system ATP-binding protein
MAPVALSNIRKSYGALPVIHGVDVDIQDGEFIVLVGPSGCGKSTLLRMIAGLEPINEGVLSIGGRMVNHLPSKDRDIAMVFQNYALYPHMTVAENMGFSLKLRGVDKEEIARRVDRSASILALEPYLDRRPRQLSGGQRQRVAMGRAIVREAAVFLFDEPLSNLDAKLRVAMRAEIKELHQRLKITTIYVTHDQTEAMTMADRIVVLNNGLVEQVGAPLDIYDRPASTFVAGFIGMPAMNLWEGTIEGGDLPLFRSRDGMAMPLSGRSALPPAGQPAIYGIRPEHVVLDDNGFDAEVVVVEPTGAETQVVLRSGRKDITMVLRERVSLLPGMRVSFSILPGREHLFDGKTGLACSQSPTNL